MGSELAGNLAAGYGRRFAAAGAFSRISSRTVNYFFARFSFRYAAFKASVACERTTNFMASLSWRF
jgi:hypothetical protein